MPVKKCISCLLIAITMVWFSMLPAFAVQKTESMPAPAGITQNDAGAETANGQKNTLSLSDRREVNLELPCKAAVLMCADTGDILYEMNAEEELPIASITKVMTLLLAMEAMEEGKISKTDMVQASEHACSMGGSQIWLAPGEEMSLDDMLKAICVSSANDAAVAVGEYIGGSEPLFAEMMNQRAKELGMEHTHFANACGLDTEGHYSTARDVAVMSRELLQHPLILEYSGIWQDSLRDGKTQLVNTNKLLKRYQGITGLKTGTTGKAGVCITATATRDGMTLIAVVLGSSSKEDRFRSASAMLDYGFAACRLAELPAYLPPKTIKVTGGEQEKTVLLCEIPRRVLIYKDDEKEFGFTTELPDKTEAPVQKNQRLGTAWLMQGEEKIAGFPIVAQNAVEKLDFRRAVKLLWKEMLRL